MKLPEPFFLIINPIMRTLLRSPLHGLLSDSLMLITYTGRRSQRKFTTPVRYLRAFPQDAAYHDIRLNQDKSLNAEDLQLASKTSIIVVTTPIT